MLDDWEYLEIKTAEYLAEYQQQCAGNLNDNTTGTTGTTGIPRTTVSTLVSGAGAGAGASGCTPLATAHPCDLDAFAVEIHRDSTWVPEIIMLVGIPGCGKTIFAEALEKWGWLRICQDEVGRKQCERSVVEAGARRGQRLARLLCGTLYCTRHNTRIIERHLFTDRCVHSV